ncbi:MAG: 23S rRNA (adenine(2503)-C(2))-methyltransferase RlmN [Propionibacteriaceae bacterium]|nr:23S rRNA (adenine(2503)-C(2))-methyltransferase RlmN [Propionibacteriaceae bacterium]
MDIPLVRRRRPPIHLFDLNADEQKHAVCELGLKPFRAKQLLSHLTTHFDADPDTWTDIAKAERAILGNELLPPLIRADEVLRADSGTTVKTLWSLFDGSQIESVLMRYGVKGIRASGRGSPRATVCVSSQAGCAMNCPFCATGQGGLQRSLSAAEILLQVFEAARALHAGELPGGPGRLSNVVFMGMGEPLANFQNVLQALRVITAPQPQGFGISARNITVSTVGLVPSIRRLAHSGMPVTLAISLHAPDDALRDKLCPINLKIPVRQVVDAAYGYFQHTGRRVSIEYALIKDINDQAWRADKLGELLYKGGHSWAHVNLIPLNPTPGSIWTASRPRDEAEFIRRLDAAHVAVSLRETRGRDIDGACGQLVSARKVQ